MLRCRVCREILRRYITPSFQPAAAWAVTGLTLLVLANIFPIMVFSVAGNAQDNLIVTGISVLVAQGYGPLALLVFYCAMVAPALYFAGVGYTAVACSIKGRLPGGFRMLDVANRMEPWSLVPVFAVACVVASVKLEQIGDVAWQAGIVWIALLALCNLVLDSVFDPAAAARRLESKEAP